MLKDIKATGVKNWTKVVLDRLAWHDLVEKSKAIEGFRMKEEEDI